MNEIVRDNPKTIVIKAAKTHTVLS